MLFNRFTTIVCLQQDIPRVLIYELNKDIRDKYLNDELGLPTCQVISPHQILLTLQNFITQFIRQTETRLY